MFMGEVRRGAVRVRLAVNDAEAGLLLRAAGARRFAYNWAVAELEANSREWAAQRDAGVAPARRVRPLSYFTLAKRWTAAKPAVAPWAGDHSTWTFRYALWSAVDAHQAFLAGRRRFPRFKSRHRDRARFTVADGLHLQPGRVRIAKYGWMRIAAPCRAQADLRRLVRRGRARLLNVNVTRHSDGHWYATVCYERTVRPHPARQDGPSIRPSRPTVGVDRGVRTNAVAATADADVVAELAGLRSLRDARRRLAHHQRNLARTQKGSANRRKAAARLARVHARVAAVRSEALHRFSAQLARTHDVIVIEDLATAQLLGNHCLAGAIADQGWAELARQLAYKTDRHGGALLVADRWYPSSKMCSCCGCVKPKLSLAERTYRCDNPACGYSADRDVNAAANLAAWGETHPRTCEGDLIQDGDRHPGGPTAGICRHACGGSNESPDPAPRLRRDRAQAAGASGEPGTSQPLTRVA